MYASQYSHHHHARRAFAFYCNPCSLWGAATAAKDLIPCLWMHRHGVNLSNGQTTTTKMHLQHWTAARQDGLFRCRRPRMFIKPEQATDGGGVGGERRLQDMQISKFLAPLLIGSLVCAKKRRRVICPHLKNTTQSSIHLSPPPLSPMLMYCHHSFTNLLHWTVICRHARDCGDGLLIVMGSICEVFK